MCGAWLWLGGALHIDSLTTYRFTRCVSIHVPWSSRAPCFRALVCRMLFTIPEVLSHGFSPLRMHLRRFRARVLAWSAERSWAYIFPTSGGKCCLWNACRIPPLVLEWPGWQRVGTGDIPKPAARTVHTEGVGPHWSCGWKSAVALHAGRLLCGDDHPPLLRSIEAFQADDTQQWGRQGRCAAAQPDRLDQGDPLAQPLALAGRDGRVWPAGVEHAALHAERVTNSPFSVARVASVVRQAAASGRTSAS